MISEIRYYLNLFWRRLPLFLLIFVLIAASGLFVAMTLPPVYRAQMRLIVEGAQIPGDLAQSTVQVSAAEQLQLFETRLLTRDNLLDVANRLTVLRDQNLMNPDEIVQAMRAATLVQSSTGRNQATVMTLSFDSPNPAMTARVLDEYLTFLLAEDAEYRAQRAGQTQQFFQQEVDRLSGELSQQSAKILDFKSKNADALPEGLDYRRQLLLDLQDRIALIDRELAGLREQKDRLSQVFEATGRVGAGSGAQLSPEEQRLVQLKAQLADLEAVYAPTSPKVVTLRNRITQLEANLAAAQGQSSAASTDPTKAMFDLQMSEIDGKIDQLTAERARQQAQADATQAQLAATPANAIALSALERDYENIQRQYNTAVDRLSKASTGERIETLARGQRISVVEQPSVPDDPVKPDRKKIAALGIVAGLFVASAVVLVLDFLSGTIKRSADMVRGLDITPMVTIPYMRTQGEILRQRLARLSLSFAIGIAIPLGLFLIHTYYMPFDQIAQKLAARIGIYI